MSENIQVGSVSVSIEASTDQFNRDIDKAKDKLSTLAEDARTLKAGEMELRNELKEVSKEYAKRQADLEKTAKQRKKSYSEAVQDYEEVSKRLKRLQGDLIENKNAQSMVKEEIKRTNDELKEQVRAYERTGKEAQKQAQQQAKDMAKAGQEVKSLTGNINHMYSMLKAVIVGYAGKTLFSAFIGSNAEWEQSMTSFEVLLGSAEAAEQKMKELSKFAAATPFDMAGLQQTSQMLLGYGVSADNLIPTMSRLGDLSQGNADKLNRVSLAYGQMLAKGKVTGEELRQMTEAQVPMLQGLADYLQISTAQLQEYISKGMVGIPELNGAIEQMTSEGGKFFGMMEKQSETMVGMWSTVKDNIAEMSREIGEEAFEGLKGTLKELVAEIDSAMADGSFAEMGAEIGHGIAIAVEALTTMAKILWDARKAIMAVGAAYATYKLAVPIIGALSTAEGLLNVIRGKAIILQNTQTGAIRIATTAQAQQVLATEGATVAQLQLNAAMLANPAVLLAVGVAAAVAAFAIFGDTLGDTARKVDELSRETDRLIESGKNVESSFEKTSTEARIYKDQASELIDELYDLDSQTELTAEEQENMRRIVSELKQIYPDFNIEIDEQTGHMITQKKACLDLVDALYKLARAQGAASAVQELTAQVMDIEVQQSILHEEAEEIRGTKKDPGKPTGRGTNWRILQNYGKEHGLNQAGGLSKQWDELEEEKNNAQKKLDKYKVIVEESELFDDTDSDDSNEKPKLTGPGVGKTKKGAKKKEKKEKSEYQIAYDELKYLRDMDLIGESEYFDQLEAIRDKYLEEDSDEWRKATIEVHKYREDAHKRSVQAYNEEKQDLKYLKDMDLISEAEYYAELEKMRDQYLVENSKEWQQATLEIHRWQIAEDQKFFKEMQAQLQAQWKKDAEQHSSWLDKKKQNLQHYIDKCKGIAQKEIDIINEQIEARKRLREDENWEDEIAKQKKRYEEIKAMMAFERDEYQYEEIQKEAIRQQESLNDTYKNKADSDFYRESADNIKAVQALQNEMQEALSRLGAHVSEKTKDRMRAEYKEQINSVMNQQQYAANITINTASPITSGQIELMVQKALDKMGG